MSPADFSAEALQDLFPAAKEKLAVYQSIDSTNAEALRRLNTSAPLYGADGSRTGAALQLDRHIFVAAQQTTGRGRTGRTFYSPQGTGVYFSFIHIPEGGIQQPAMLTARTAVAVSRAIDRCFNEHCGIKWVNDIYLHGKKVCGILAEGWAPLQAQFVQAAAVGIGINISMEAQEQNPELHNAGGILTEQRQDADMRMRLVSECLANIFAILDADENIMPEYRERSVLTGKTVTVSPLAGGNTSQDAPHSYTATVDSIADDATLVVRLQDGSLRSLSSGEVTLHNQM